MIPFAPGSPRSSRRVVRTALWHRPCRATLTLATRGRDISPGFASIECRSSSSGTLELVAMLRASHRYCSTSPHGIGQRGMLAEDPPDTLIVTAPALKSAITGGDCPADKRRTLVFLI